MIYSIKRESLFVNRPSIDIQYIGEDALKANVSDEIKELIKNSLNKDCLTSSGDRGVIIGFEDCDSLEDYYFIIFCPKTAKIVYELMNNNNLIVYGREE